MSTTALLVEILIIGFEVSLWFLLILAMLPNRAWIDGLLCLSSNNAFIAAGALVAVVYLLGTVADKTAKWIVEASLSSYLFRFKSRTPCELDVSPEMRLHPGRIATLLQWLLRPYAVTEAERPGITSAKDTLKKYSKVVMKVGEPMSDLLYGRSKVRILRASIFNVPLIVLFWAAHGVLAVLQVADESALALGTWTVPRWTGIVAVGVAGLAVALLSARYFNWLYCYNLHLFRERLDCFYRSRGTGRA